MTHIRGRFGLPQSKPGSNDRLIPWVETDPRRAPMRNDLVTALQASISPLVFLFVFFSGYYETRMAVGATVVMTLMIFGISFALTWARMASARRPRPTTRSARGKLRLALVVAVILAVATALAAISTYPDRTIQIVLGLFAGTWAAAIVLLLETYAVDVPAADIQYRNKQRAKYDI